MAAAPKKYTAAKWFRLALLTVLLCSAAFTPQPIQAAANMQWGSDWAVVASQENMEAGEWGSGWYDAIYMIQRETNTVHGPFLMQELTHHDEVTGAPLGGDLLDVAVTPDSKTAVISSFSKSLVHFVDISEPLEPVYLSSLKLEFYAEDIVITPDGRYALVTDGGSSRTVESIDIKNRSVAFTLELPEVRKNNSNNPIYGRAQAVTVAPNGTVVVVDYFNGAIYSLLIDADGVLTYTGMHSYSIAKDGTIRLTPDSESLVMHPVNIAIAPDGQTVLVSDTTMYVDTSAPQYTYLYGVGVYKITAPGTMEFVEAITGFPHAMQTITFNKTGSKAIMLGNGSISFDSSDPANPSVHVNNPDAVYLLDILSPGVVEYTPGQSTELAHHTTSQLFGVDGLAVLGNKAYASYPNAPIDTTAYPNRYISVVDLTTLQVTQIDWGLSGKKFPAGIAAAPYVPNMLYLPSVTMLSGK